MSLRDYERKRRFADTPEPADDRVARKRGRGVHRPIFVVQLHSARARHYDFRLEVDGALKSWAVPKGPSLRPGEKRLAVEVEDHPLSYADFQGAIPEGNYGAGHVLVFDHGVWSCQGDPLEAIAAGKLEFSLHGSKLRGAWKLIRTAGKRGSAHAKPTWLLLKRDDAYARDVEADDLVDGEPGPESSAQVGRVWISGQGGRDVETPPISGAKIPKKAQPVTGPRRNDVIWHKRALALNGARDHPFPMDFRPELASQREHAPKGDEWLHEVKWDGYRMLADLVDGKARLRSRNGSDWTRDFPGLVEAIEALPVSDARLDGELVALDARGQGDFAQLQRTLQGSADAPLRYVVFDLPGLAGVDLSPTALRERKELLETLLATSRLDALVYSQHVVGHGDEVFAASGREGLEGILSKRVDAPYTQARSAHWIKVKHVQNDEFVIVGYSDPQGTRKGFGALLMATPRDDGTLRYIGRVGTGFNDETLRTLHARMRLLPRKTATVVLPDDLPWDKRDRGNIHWLKPQLVADIAFRGWGKDGLLRQASFQRLRDDKTPEDLHIAGKKQARADTPKKSLLPAPAKAGAKRLSAKPAIAQRADAPTPATTARERKRSARSPQTQISSRDRVVFAEAGITKGEVADYYAAVADLLLADMANRPLSLLRCPDGAQATCFFQKHHVASLGTHVRAVPLRQKSGAEEYLYVRNAAGLLELVQMNTLEFHPWGAHVDKPEKPDTLVFDLDPGPGVTWKQVVAGARDVRARLQETGLDSFVRLSGGKGVHVVAPIARGPSWDDARDFAGAFAEAMAAHRPLHYVATMSKAKRDGRIFIDWLRNSRGATSVASWSLRARPGAPVAVPIRWDELGRVGKPDAFDLRKALRRANALKRDPWEDYGRSRQTLPRLA